VKVAGKGNTGGQVGLGESGQNKREKHGREKDREKDEVVVLKGKSEPARGGGGSRMQKKFDLWGGYGPPKEDGRRVSSGIRREEREKQRTGPFL